MELSRIKVLFAGLILQLLCTIAAPLPYNKYGRKCSDIGCLSSQVCVMAYESCSLGQREGNECGRYPTCKKNTEAGLAAGPSDNVDDLYSNKPAPPKTSSSVSDDDVLTSLGLSPNAPNNNRPAPSNPNSNGYSNPYPNLPPPSQPASPYNPPRGSSNNNNYYGGGGGASGIGGGSVAPAGGNRRPGQFDGSGGNIVVPTQKPAAPSGGFFSGIFGGVQNAVSNAIKQQVGTYINQRLGIGPAAGQAGGAGGLGSFLDARNFIDSKKGGSLFSERKPASESSATGPYPVTVEQRGQAYSSRAAPNRGSSSETTYTNRQANNAGTPAPYGWKLD